MILGADDEDILIIDSGDEEDNTGNQVTEVLQNIVGAMRQTLVQEEEDAWRNVELRLRDLREDFSTNVCTIFVNFSIKVIITTAPLKIL